MNKWIPEHSCDKKTPICDVLKQKKNDVKNTPPETIRNEKNSMITKEQNSKNADCGFTGRFAKRFSGERPDPLGFELTFLSEFSELFLRVLDRGALLRACYMSSARQRAI